MKALVKFLPLPALLLFSIQLNAQNKLPIKFGKVTAQDFELKSSLIDSGTNAVVIADAGKSEFVANSSDGTFSLLFKQNTRIKILNKNGFDAATVVISLYMGDNGKSEKLEDIDAFTYNLEEGKVVKTKVDKGSVFTEQASKNWIRKKFTFPALKEGSIIEYATQIKSDFFFNLQPWAFQRDYPVLWSQYETAIPEFFRFVILSQGYHPFFINTKDESTVSYTFTEHVERERGGFSGRNVSSGIATSKLDGKLEYRTWVMKDVPPLKEESFTTTLNNSIAKIEFQLKEVAYPNQIPRPYMSSWLSASKDLMDDERFGIPISRANNWLDEAVAVIVKDAASPAAKTKIIYEYVRDHYTCNNFNRYYITNGLKEVVKNKAGSVADINMLLIAMLRNQKITADPVLLSTRNHGYTDELYPLMDKFNYVIVKVTIDNISYFLDAATPKLAFNRLPAQAYNGHARVIDNQARPVFFSADSLREINSTTVFIQNNDKGEINGTIVKDLGYYHSLSLRNKMAKVGLDDYQKEVQRDLPEDIVLNKIDIDSLKLLDETVQIRMDLALMGFHDADIVYFNPMMGEAIQKNPFVSAERFYPVEMPFTVDDIYTLNMDVPKGYMIDELPKSVRLLFNEDEGMFEYLVSKNEQSIQMRCRLQLKRATYSNEDYQSLRDFYAYIVKKESEQIVFKKVR